jgi:16S rRNA (guanine527-N7)-methyltransferase
MRHNDRPTRVHLGAQGFTKLFPVSRETFDRLALYVDLLERWNRRINLVGRDTMGDVWRRHVLDSAQLFPLIPKRARVLVDLGSGAGLPGLILAILGVPDVHLVESDQRKAAFLREALRVTDTKAQLHVQRIEAVPPFPADVVTARALAPLTELLPLAEPFFGKSTLCLFLKGKAADDELTRAGEAWKMRVERVPSASDPSGTILRLESLARESLARAAPPDVAPPA